MRQCFAVHILFIVVKQYSNNVTPNSGSTICSNTVENYEQCGQHNDVNPLYCVQNWEGKISSMLLRTKSKQDLPVSMRWTMPQYIQ